MNKEVTIIIAEDDDGHAMLIKKNLQRAGVINDIKHFKDGQEVLDFFDSLKDKNEQDLHHSYLLLLDIRMPKVDGIEVLTKLKQDPVFKKIPVIIVTTTENPQEIDLCHKAGCNNYIQKPINYDNFVQVIRQLGFFLAIIEIPTLSSGNSGNLIC